MRSLSRSFEDIAGLIGRVIRSRIKMPERLSAQQIAIFRLMQTFSSR